MYCCKMQMQMCQSRTWKMEILEIPSSSSKSKHRRRICPDPSRQDGYYIYHHTSQSLFLIFGQSPQSGGLDLVVL
jgi:hypothetical protein